MEALEREIRRTYDDLALRFGADHRSVRYHSASSLRLDRRMVADVVRRNGGRRILDVGCGWGSLTAPLVAPDRRFVGVDLSHEMLRLAAGRDLRPVGGSALRLPFHDSSFDGAILGGFLQILPDAAPALAEAFRVVRRGGWVFASSLLLGSIPRRVHAAFCPTRYRDFHGHGPAEMEDIVRARGLGRVAAVQYEYPPLPIVVARPTRKPLPESLAVNYGITFVRA